MNRLARLAFRVAALLMPPGRRDWLAAMRAEYVYLHGGESLRWALGCLYAACKERFAPMKTGDFRVSRWVMLIETIGCFGSLTVACVEFTSLLWNFSRLDWEFVSKVYLDDPGETFMLTTIALGAVVGLVGPIGVFLGLRFVLSGRALANRRLGYALLAALSTYAVAVTMGYFVGPPDFTTTPFIVAVVLLPMVGIAHLLYLGRPAATRAAPPPGLPVGT